MQYRDRNSLTLDSTAHTAPDVRLTRHARCRVRQRGMRENDASFVVRHGTEAGNGYIFTQKDEEEIVRQAKSLMQTARRLRGKYIVCDGGDVITAFHATDRQQHRLL